MDIYELRKRNLKRLIADGVTTAADVARRIEKPPSQVSRWLSDTTKGPRKITEDSARYIEAALQPLGVTTLWLDQPHDGEELQLAVGMTEKDAAPKTEAEMVEQALSSVLALTGLTLADVVGDVDQMRNRIERAMRPTRRPTHQAGQWDTIPSSPEDENTDKRGAQ